MKATETTYLILLPDSPLHISATFQRLEGVPGVEEPVEIMEGVVKLAEGVLDVVELKEGVV